MGARETSLGLRGHPFRVMGEGGELFVAAKGRDGVETAEFANRGGEAPIRMATRAAAKGAPAGAKAG